MSLAYHNFLQEKMRSLLSIVGVGLAIMLMLVLNGFLNGISQSASTYLDHEPGSVIVARQGEKDFALPGLPLPPSTVSAARQIPGVARVIPILTQTVFFTLHGQKQFVYLIGYDPQMGGGPWSLAEGREPRTDAEMVLDRVLARQQQISVGDTLPIMNQRFTVVGLSTGTGTWMESLLFVRKTAAESLLLAPGAASLLLVTPAPGISAQALQTRLRALPGTNVLLKSEMVSNDIKLLTSVYGAPIQLMATIAFLIGVLVVGLIVYTATVERQREYGVLKAIGARNSMLYRTVTTQAGLVAGTGSIVGIGLALGVAQFIMAVRPQFLIVLEPAAMGQALAAGLVMAGLSAFFPARLLAGLAPAEVFRR